MIKTARDLTEVSLGQPRQANLRRAVSTAYYALFHCLARSCADAFIGTSGAQRSLPAWHQVYRALEHGSAANACGNQAVIQQFPQGVQDFAYTFTKMRKERHIADYSLDRRFYKSAVELHINKSEREIQKFNGISITNRRAFAAFILFKNRRG